VDQIILVSNYKRLIRPSKFFISLILEFFLTTSPSQMEKLRDWCAMLRDGPSALAQVWTSWRYFGLESSAAVGEESAGLARTEPSVASVGRVLQQALSSHKERQHLN
jgi:hypothetical protein